MAARGRGRLRGSAAWALAFVLADVVGVGWCWWRRRRRGRRENGTTTFGGARVARFASLLVLGALFRTFVAIRGVRPCVTEQSAGRYGAAPALLVNSEKAVM